MKHIPRKRFGQNFLQDPSIIKQIIDLINPTPTQKTIEIGPGLAALTTPLIAKLRHLSVIELDRDLIKKLQQQFNPAQLTIHQGDALQFDFSFNQQELLVVGNLPYNISTPLLFHLSQFSNISQMIFMLQKEVVSRICAEMNNRDYGKLSVMLQYKYKCRYLLDVPPESFYPAPKVDSAIISLTPRTDYNWQEIDETKLNLIVSSAFNQRRKTISNSLKTLFTNQQLIDAGINPQARAENLSIANYVYLSKLI